MSSPRLVSLGRPYPVDHWPSIFEFLSDAFRMSGTGFARAWPYGPGHVCLWYQGAADRDCEELMGNDPLGSDVPPNELSVHIAWLH